MINGIPVINLFEEFYPSIKLFNFIYTQSKIPQLDYYKTCAMIAYKSHNSQTDVEKMEYYVFNNYMSFMNEFIESENKSDGKTGEETPQETAQNTMKETMSSQKSMMKSIKLPH